MEDAGSPGSMDTGAVEMCRWMVDGSGASIHPLTQSDLSCAPADYLWIEEDPIECCRSIKVRQSS